jgi:pimeloyl-ACP methyl ester carboxylesterase
MPVYHTAAGTVEMLEWGEGPELFVLLHAAAAGPHSLSALAALLVRQGPRVIAPALHRYGATLRHDATDRMQTNVAVLRACLDIHAAERRVVFGHSMGGLVGLLGALGGLPLDALVLYEPIVTACLGEDAAALRDWDRAIVAEVEQSITAGDPQAGVAAFITAWNETPWSGLPSAARARLVAAAEQLAADMHAVSYCALPTDDLRHLQTPVLLLQGALSPPITHAMSARLYALLPHAQLHRVEGCGHMGPVLSPEAIVSALPQARA